MRISCASTILGLRWENNVKTSDFYFDLPQELIAQTPLERRDGSRLLTLDKQTGAVRHMHFYDLPTLLRPGDCLVLNDSRVMPARLLGKRAGGGACEVLLLIDRGNDTWECLVRPGKKLHTGAVVTFGAGELTAEVVGETEGGTGRRRKISDGVFQSGGLSGCANCGASFHKRAAAAGGGYGCKGVLCYTSCRAWNIPSGEGRKY